MRHLKHIGPLGLAFLTSMFKTALNRNIIPHTLKLANIIPIPKPNKNTDRGTSYRPISILSVIAKTLEKSLLPYITANIPNTPMQHGYKTQHSTGTALLTLNNTVAKGFNQMAPHARTITVALDMSKAFETINIHTLTRKLLQTNIPGTLIKFIANYIKVHKAYTTYRNHTSRQCQFKTGVPQGGVLLPTRFNIYISHLPPPNAPVQVMAHTDRALPMATHPKVLSLTIDQKLTYSTHIHTISVQAHKPLQIIKADTATGWGKQKETLMATYKAVMRPALEYASSVWSPIASSTSINKLQVMQNAALRTATGCTQDTNIQNLHDKRLILLIHEHLQLHASQYKQKTQHSSHPLHKHTTYFNTSRLKQHYFKQRPLHNKHSHRPPHSHYTRHKNKHAPYTYI